MAVTQNTKNVRVPPSLQTAENGIGAVLLKLAPFIIVAITALLYSKAIFNDFVSFDDYQFIVKNPAIKDSTIDGLLRIFTKFNAGKYQPFTTLSFALEYRFFGLNPLPYHVTNIVLHLLSTFVLFKIVERLSSSRITAIVVALLFGIHPMHVEEVAWVSERKDMLYAFFYLWAIFVYLRYMESGYRLKYYIGVLVLFLISLFSKTEAITLPLVLFIIDVYKARKITLKPVLEKIPMLAFSFFIGTLGFISQQVHGFEIAEPITIYGFMNRVFLFTTVPAFYIAKLFAPFNLSAEHYYPDMQSGLLPWAYYASLPFILLMIWLVVRRSPFRKEKIFGASLFLVVIAFMPQVIFTGPAITPERYSYIPYIGIFYIIGQWITVHWTTKWKTPIIIAFTIVSAVFCVLTWQRIDVWKNSVTLYTDIINKNDDIKDMSFFYWLRGNAYEADGDLNAAIEDYNYVIVLQPTTTKVYERLGDVNLKTGHAKDAIADFDAAIRLSPDVYMNYYNRAASKAIAADFNGALKDYNSFIEHKPDDDVAYNARGMVRLSLKDSAGACEDWRKAATLGNQTAPQLMQQWCH